MTNMEKITKALNDAYLAEIRADGIVRGLETGLIEEIEDFDSWVGDLKSLWGED